jgi:hypothetical protein
MNETNDHTSDHASPEDVLEREFRQKVDEGLRQLDADEGIEHDEAKRRLGKWLNWPSW